MRSLFTDGVLDEASEVRSDPQAPWTVAGETEPFASWLANRRRFSGMARAGCLSLFGLVGIVFVVGGCFLLLRISLLVNDAVTAQGQVVAVVRDSVRRVTTYYPLIRFSDASGREVEFKAGWGTNPSHFQPRDAVQVVYRRGNPEQAQINRAEDLWFGPILLTLVGVICLAAVMAFARCTRGRDKFRPDTLRRWWHRIRFG